MEKKSEEKEQLNIDYDSSENESNDMKKLDEEETLNHHLQKSSIIKKNKKDNLKINVILNLIYELLVIISPLLTAPYISRVLGPSGVGTYSYVYSLVTFFVLVASLGTINYGKKEIARWRNDKLIYSRLFWEIEIVTIITSFFCVIFWLLFSFIYSEYTIYMLILTFTIVSALFDISWFYGGLEKFKFTVVINSIVKITSIVLVFVLVKSNDDLIKYFFIITISILLGNVSMWLFLPMFLVKTKVSIRGIFFHFKNTFIYFLPTIATSVYTVLDKTLIGSITNDLNENGYYEQATKLINLLKTACFSAINGVMISRASYLFGQNNKAGIKKLTHITYNINLFLTIGAIFGLVAIANVFVPIFFGEGYDKVVILIYIFSPILAIICISTTIGSLYYVPNDKIKYATIFIIIASIVNLVLNLILIPNYGAVGAAIASVCAELVTMILHVIFCKHLITFKDLFFITYKKIISGVLMFFAIFFFNKYVSIYIINDIIILMIDLVIGVIIYILLLALLKDYSITILFTSIKEKMSRIKN